VQKRSPCQVIGHPGSNCSSRPAYAPDIPSDKLWSCSTPLSVQLPAIHARVAQFHPVLNALRAGPRSASWSTHHEPAPCSLHQCAPESPNRRLDPRLQLKSNRAANRTPRSIRKWSPQTAVRPVQSPYNSRPRSHTTTKSKPLSEVRLI